MKMVAAVAVFALFLFSVTPLSRAIRARSRLAETEGAPPKSIGDGRFTDDISPSGTPDTPMQNLAADSIFVDLETD